MDSLRPRNRFLGSIIAEVFGLIAKGFDDDLSKARRRKRAFYRFGGYSYKPNGERETARRRAQIECGQLKRENGLVV